MTAASSSTRLALRNEETAEMMFDGKPIPQVILGGTKRRSGRGRAVYCIELSRRFNRVKDVAAFIRQKPSNIVSAITKPCRAGGYRWEYAE